MDRRRSSSRTTSRLILRVYGAESLRHVSSQGTYCKIYVDEAEMTRGSHSMGGSARSSLKRFLNQSSSDTSRHHHASSSNSDGDSLDNFSPRIYKTKTQKALRGDPVWKEIFEIPVFDVQHEVLTIRIKTARLMSAPAIGVGSIALREISPDSTWDKWINLLDSSKRPAGKLRIQMRLLPPGYVPSPRADDDVVNGDEKFLPRRTNSQNSQNTSPLPRSARRSAIIAPPIGGVGIIRRSSALSRSLVESRTSSSTTASDSISSDYSNDRLSVPAVSPYPQNDSIGSPESPSPQLRRPSQSPATRESRQSSASSLARDTTLSTASRATEELDMLANKYMTRSQVRASHRAPSQTLRPTMPSVAERKVSTTKELSIPELSLTEESPESPEGPPSPQAPVPSPPQNAALNTSIGPTVKELKDDRSPRTTNTTTGSSDEDEPQDETVEFDFDTGDVRPSSRLPAHMMRSSSVAKYRVDLEHEISEESSDEDEPEDDEMDPDEDPEGPRMVLRRTVMNVLGRTSVNVIMDEDDEDDDDDLDFDQDAFVFDELPMLDMADSIVLLKDVDFADFGLPAPSS